MMKYIDADSIKDEIKHLKIDVYDESHQFDLGARCSLTFLESFIDSLQQEQPEVDLDFSMFAKEMDVVFNLPEEVTKNTEQNPLNWEYAIARHFYEFGLNAREEDKK